MAGQHPYSGDLSGKEVFFVEDGFAEVLRWLDAVMLIINGEDHNAAAENYRL